MVPRPGPILVVDTDIELGRHNGLWTYTIGQGAKLGGLSTKLFVAAKDHKKNAIYVAPPESVVAPLHLLCLVISALRY
jgi:tRNA-5-taurinomethyluridine 2-sulfurtransferase